MFHERTKRWFRESVGEPTQVQREAWPAIAAGESTLISAPTGTGKTLSAFLVWIDRLKSEAEAGTLSDGVQVIYISPFLKIQLTISLHAATQSARNRIIPHMRIYAIEDCQHFQLPGHQPTG